MEWIEVFNNKTENCIYKYKLYSEKYKKAEGYLYLYKAENDQLFYIFTTYK